ncbi:MAG: glycosyltransferase family 2 protein, partial [Lachnospiraceae bacterium]|nr:glycosyltransferase family 2 protein [Lachnospiraceae bacterium]
GIQQFRRNFDLAVSQADHPEVFEEIRSESEGIRMVKQTMWYLCRSRKACLLPSLVYKSGCKYAGYRLGRCYRKLPQWMILRCTANRLYWMKS